MQAPPVSKKSDTARADVKKETAAANKAGRDSWHRGRCWRDHGRQKQVKDAKSTTPRADRKKATAEANKAGTIPATEAQMQAPKK